MAGPRLRGVIFRHLFPARSCRAGRTGGDQSFDLSDHSPRNGKRWAATGSVHTYPRRSKAYVISG